MKSSRHAICSTVLLQKKASATRFSLLRPDWAVCLAGALSAREIGASISKKDDDDEGDQRSDVTGAADVRELNGDSTTARTESSERRHDRLSLSQLRKSERVRLWGGETWGVCDPKSDWLN